MPRFTSWRFLEFPIQYEIVEDVDIHTLVYHEDKSVGLKPLQTAAKKLEKMSCRVIVMDFAFSVTVHRDYYGHV